jgi:eight-cysteine-cluster-containing protein
MNKQAITVLVLVVLVVLVGIVLYGFKAPAGNYVSQPVIASFDECVKAGYPVMESYPRQCRVPDGELFVEPIVVTPSPNPTPVVKGGCFVGGCSGQICSDQEGAMSTCEYRPQYGCYKNATCERQMNGQCGWTQTALLTGCLNAD